MTLTADSDLLDSITRHDAKALFEALAAGANPYAVLGVSPSLEACHSEFKEGLEMLDAAGANVICVATDALSQGWSDGARWLVSRFGIKAVYSSLWLTDNHKGLGHHPDDGDDPRQELTSRWTAALMAPAEIRTELCSPPNGQEIDGVDCNQLWADVARKKNTSSRLLDYMEKQFGHSLPQPLRWLADDPLLLPSSAAGRWVWSRALVNEDLRSACINGFTAQGDTQILSAAMKWLSKNKAGRDFLSESRNQLLSGAANTYGQAFITVASHFGMTTEPSSNLWKLLQPSPILGNCVKNGRENSWMVEITARASLALSPARALFETASVALKIAKGWERPAPGIIALMEAGAVIDISAVQNILLSRHKQKDAELVRASYHARSLGVAVSQAPTFARQRI
jgi:hypothetical protein